LEFLVQLTVSLPQEMPDEQRKQLLAKEWLAGRELKKSGVIRRIWRIPGGLRNVGIWEASDATELHERITSLPLSKWIQADVTALARHPVEYPEDRASGGSGTTT
jgi:muconolactone D-isomerase